MNIRKGISLIVLVITIIVIIILAGAIILSLVNNNPITQANKATYLSDVKNFETELRLYETKQFENNMGAYDPKLLQADETSVTYNGIIDNVKTINDLIPVLGKTIKYAGQFAVVDGELVYQGKDINRQTWSTESGIKVEVAGEPKITILSPTETAIAPGTDIVYTIKFSSNIAITTIDLTNKIEVLDNNETVLATQPIIALGTVSGTNVDNIRQVEVTIKTDSLTFGAYKLKVKAGSATNIDNISNSQDKISLVGFDITDNVPPENPTMLANVTAWTNSDVTVTITYSSDSNIKEYSLDGTTWNNYTQPVVVTENNKTIYARGKDSAGNESGVATLTVSNIDKFIPTAQITMTPNTNIDTATNITWGYSSLQDPDGDVIVNQQWENKQSLYTTAGTYTVRLRVQDSKGFWSDWTSISFQVANVCYSANYGSNDFMTQAETITKIGTTQDSTLTSRLTTIRNANTLNTYPYIYKDSVNDFIAVGYKTNDLSNYYNFTKYSTQYGLVLQSNYNTSMTRINGYFQGYNFNSSTGTISGTGYLGGNTISQRIYWIYNTGRYFISV